MACIYQQAKEAYGIQRPIPIILAEDETKVKSRIGWDSKGDFLIGFCGPHKGDDHKCVTDFQPAVDIEESGYNVISDAYSENTIGSFARMIIVNTLHEKLPKLVFVVCCTCNCFTTHWVRRQWHQIDLLWSKECLEAGKLAM